MEDVLTFDGVVDQLLINPNTAIINILVHPLIFPFILGNRKVFEFLCDFHFNLDVALVVLFELLPLIRGMIRRVASAVLIGLSWFTRGAEVADQFFSSRNFLSG